MLGNQFGGDGWFVGDHSDVGLGERVTPPP